jgi:hypothetical protein
MNHKTTKGKSNYETYFPSRIPDPDCRHLGSRIRKEF